MGRKQHAKPWVWYQVPRLNLRSFDFERYHPNSRDVCQSRSHYTSEHYFSGMCPNPLQPLRAGVEALGRAAAWDNGSGPRARPEMKETAREPGDRTLPTVDVRIFIERGIACRTESSWDKHSCRHAIRLPDVTDSCTTALAASGGFSKLSWLA